MSRKACKPPVVTRNCDECQHHAPKIETPRDICALGHKPRFYTPRSLAKAMQGDWGWKRRCADYAAQVAPQSQEAEPL